MNTLTKATTLAGATIAMALLLTGCATTTPSAAPTPSTSVETTTTPAVELPPTAPNYTPGSPDCSSFTEEECLALQVREDARATLHNAEEAFSPYKSDHTRAPWVSLTTTDAQHTTSRTTTVDGLSGWGTQTPDFTFTISNQTLEGRIFYSYTDDEGTWLYEGFYSFLREME